MKRGPAFLCPVLGGFTADDLAFHSLLIDKKCWKGYTYSKKFSEVRREADLMGKIHTLLTRVRSMSFSRMWLHVRAIHEESGRPRLVILCDMVYCALRYGVGYLDYHVFGFAWNRGACRKTFMTMNDNLALVRALNDRAYYHVFDDKVEFNKRFDKYIGREWINLQTADKARFRAFLQGKDVVFAKNTGLCGGAGISRIEAGKEDPDELYDRLRESGQFLVEQKIVQHPEMDRLCPSSVNTVRIVTVLKNGEAHFMYSLVRIGNGKSAVDNITSGGLYTAVPEDGVLKKPAFCDKTGKYYDSHPATGTVFAGFRIPMFRQAVELCLEAALVEPHMGYIGWDVAITEAGPVLVEGNTIPGYDMCQNHGHLEQKGVGILPKFRSVAGDF